MELNNEVIKRIWLCDWFVNCGTKEDSIRGNEFERLTKISQVENSINSTKWENTCLEARNELTVYLTLNEPDVYNVYWNVLVNQIKKEVIPKVIDDIEEKAMKKCLPEESVAYVRMDIINIIMVLSYSKYYQSSFYQKLLYVYEHGYLPCGWRGRYPKGKLLVY